MAKKLRRPRRPSVRTDSLSVVLELGRYLNRCHSARFRQEAVQQLAETWGTSVVHLRRARLFATRCSVEEVQELQALELRWTQVRHLIAIKSRYQREQIAKRASRDRKLTVEKFAALVAPHVGRKTRSRPAVELKRLRRRCRELSVAVQRCRFRGHLPQRLHRRAKSARAAIFRVQLKLQTLDDTLARMLGT